MAVFCPVAPARILAEMKHDDPKSIQHNLFLAHDVVEHADEYHGVFDDFHHFSFMDNSLVELKAAVDVKMVADAVNITRANVYVLPDVYGDGPATVDAILYNYQEWDLQIRNAVPMAVIQGNSPKEWIDCLERVAARKQFPWIAIPRVTERWNHGNRWDLVDLVHAYFPRSRIHLLGFVNTISLDILSARHPCVSSIDSAVPLRMASNHEPFSAVYDPGPRGDWWTSCSYTPMMTSNTLRVGRLLATTAQERYADISV